MIQPRSIVPILSFLHFQVLIYPPIATPVNPSSLDRMKMQAPGCSLMSCYRQSVPQRPGSTATESYRLLAGLADCGSGCDATDEDGQ